METLFPFCADWHWPTFVLYVSVGMTVSLLCRKGAQARYVCRKECINLYYFLAWLILMLLGGLRNIEVGPDTAFYISMFEESGSEEYSLLSVLRQGRWEPGFMIYLYIMRVFTDSYTVLLLVTYGIVAYGYIRFISEFYKRRSDYIFLQIFIFYYVNNMSAMRSALACVFFFLSLIALCRDRFLKATLLTLAACLFHYSMIFNLYIIVAMILLKACHFMEHRRWWVVAAIVIVIAANLALNTIQSLMTATRYAFYTRTVAAGRSLWGSVFVIAYAILAVWNMHERSLSKSRSLHSLLQATLCFMVSYPMIYFIGAYRLSYYFALPRLTVWSRIANIYRKRWFRKWDTAFRAVEQAGVILYLLFLFTRFANSGNFAYRLFIM